MGAFYAFAGINHFLKPKFYLKITPPYIPFPKAINIIVGLLEVVLAVLLIFPPTRAIGAWGIMILLILVFPANCYHHMRAREKGKHVMATFIRLPIQVLLIYWAYIYI